MIGLCTISYNGIGLMDFRFTIRHLNQELDMSDSTHHRLWLWNCRPWL